MSSIKYIKSEHFYRFLYVGEIKDTVVEMFCLQCPSKKEVYRAMGVYEHVILLFLLLSTPFVD